MNDEKIINILSKKAKWIWCNEKADINSHVDFVFEFSAEIADTDAFIAISADSEYVLSINSQFVSCGQFKMFPPEKSVDIIPIGSVLKSGVNRICVSVQYFGISNMSYSVGKAGLCFYLKNFDTEIFSDESILAAKSACYHSGKIFGTTPQVGLGYIYNASNDDGWKEFGSKISTRFKKAVCINCEAVLVKRPTKRLNIAKVGSSKLISQGCFIRTDTDDTPAKLMAGDYLKFVERKKLFIEDKQPFIFNLECSEGSSGFYAIFDLGCETSGYFSMEIDTTQNTCVDIGYGEHLEDFRVRTAIENRNFADRYIACEGRQRFTHYFRRIAGRYLELHFTGAEHLTIYSATVLSAVYPFNEKKMPLLNPLRTKIYKTSIETLKNCMHEHYEDCPWREQALYSYDSRNQALCSYSAFHNPEFTRASLMLLGQSLGSDGFIKICAPTDEKLKIPSFTFVWVLEALDYIQHYRDESFIPYAYKITSAILSAACQSIKDGLAQPPIGNGYWHFYEWSEGVDGIERSNANSKMTVRTANDGIQDGMYQLYVVMALCAGAEIAKNANRNDTAKKYLSISHSIQENVNKIFWDTENQLYCTYKNKGRSVHYCEYMQALALYSKTAVNSAALCQRLIDGMNNKITLSSSLYKYEGLLKADKSMLGYVLKDIDKIWGDMLERGATTFWETSDGAEAFMRAGSLCHGWSAIPIYIYEKYLSKE